MDFIVATEEELQKERNQPRQAGVYDFTCIDSEQNESQAGNPQFKIKLKCFDDKGSFIVTNWLQIAGPMRFQLKHFWDSVGQPEKYTSGKLDAFDFIDKSGKVELSVRPGNAEYPNPSNSVKDYYVGKEPKGLESLPDTAAADLPEWLK